MNKREIYQYHCDLVAALIITAGLFIMSTGIVEKAVSYKPPTNTVCRDQFGHRKEC